MRKIILLFLALSMTGSVWAQREDPLDLNIKLDIIEQYGVPTVSGVERQGVISDSLYNAKDWGNAADALLVYAKQANLLANLLAQCGEPYYSASEESRRIDYQRNMSDRPIIPYIEKSNELKRDRNAAIVKIGICYKELGDNTKAIAYLYKGLDLLSLEELEYWEIAREAIAEIVGFKP